MSEVSKRRSKLLSLILRHAPERAGLRLETGGWVEVDALLRGLARMDVTLSRTELEAIVRENDKKRFTLSGDGTRIRAAQGHSVDVEIARDPITPPDTLFHGTSTRTLPLIREGGLKPMSRQHVHLSADRETARTVGARHGKPVVLIVDAAAMTQAGYEFFRAENGVWLTADVQPRFLREAP